MSPLPREILVIGSGIAGPVFATFMLLTASPAASKPHITVLERAPFVRSQGQNVDIRGAGVTIMRKLGLETAIRSCVTGEEGVMFVDTHNNTIATGPADKTGKVQTGTSDIEILRGTLADICYKRCVSVSDEVKKEGGAGVDFVFGDYAEKIEQHGNSVLVTFAKSGERKSYDLVVGADGLLSSTRGLVWGEEGEEERLHRLGVYGGFFNMPRGETDTMWRRWYRAPGGKGIMVRPSDTPDKTTVFMLVCNDEDVRFREVTTKRPDVQKQKQLLTEYFEGAGWECDRVVKELNAADDFYYSMIAQVKMEKWSKGRVVLVGDAGYVLHYPTHMSLY
jgi:2-polyprenyl-6-methoxyphenol hydroxylase-like FAD-dependent oxidoreductase